MKEILLFISITCSLFSSAQTEKEIRDHYTAINKQIDESIKNGFEGPLYNNQWIANKNGKSWPAVGNYTETTDFWYDDPPDHLPVLNTVISSPNLCRSSRMAKNTRTCLLKLGCSISGAQHLPQTAVSFCKLQFNFLFYACTGP